MSSLSSNDKSDSRGIYYSAQMQQQQQQQHQLQYQHQQLHQVQYQQKQQLLNHNSISHNSNNINNNSNNLPNNYNINNTYSSASCLGNYSQLTGNAHGIINQQHINNNIPATLSHHSNSSHSHYQHPSLSTVFPSIYAETNFNNNNSSGN